MLLPMDAFRHVPELVGRIKAPEESSLRMTPAAGELGISDPATERLGRLVAGMAGDRAAGGRVPV